MMGEHAGLRQGSPVGPDRSASCAHLELVEAKAAWCGIKHHCIQNRIVAEALAADAIPELPATPTTARGALWRNSRVGLLMTGERRPP